MRAEGVLKQPMCHISDVAGAARAMEQRGRVKAGEAFYVDPHRLKEPADHRRAK